MIGLRYLINFKSNQANVIINENVELGRLRYAGQLPVSSLESEPVKSFLSANITSITFSRTSFSFVRKCLLTQMNLFILFVFFSFVFFFRKIRIQ